MTKKIETNSLSHGGGDCPHGISRRRRSITNRFLQRNAVIEQPITQEECLRPIEPIGYPRPELLGLPDERRNDQQTDQSQRADDDYVHNENRQPPRKPPGADRYLLLMFDGVDNRSKADGQQHADVDDEERATCQKQCVKNRETTPRDGNGHRYGRGGFFSAIDHGLAERKHRAAT